MHKKYLFAFVIQSVYLFQEFRIKAKHLQGKSNIPRVRISLDNGRSHEQYIVESPGKKFHDKTYPEKVTKIILTCSTDCKEKIYEIKFFLYFNIKKSIHISKYYQNEIFKYFSQQTYFQKQGVLGLKIALANNYNFIL